MAILFLYPHILQIFLEPFSFSFLPLFLPPLVNGLREDGFELITFKIGLLNGLFLFHLIVDVVVLGKVIAHLRIAFEIHRREPLLSGITI